MPTWICPECNASMTVKASLVGQVRPCAGCGAESEITDADALAAMLNDADGVEVPVEVENPKQYKVLAQKDDWWNQKIDPVGLEALLNEHARQGWTLKAAVTASIPAVFGRSRDEMIIILEK